MALLGLEINEDDLDRYEWDFVDPPPNDYFCPLCDKVLRKPVLTACCGFHFCEDCGEEYYGCPTCDDSIGFSILDKQKWGKILELDVQCPLHNRGCMWTGELALRGNHLDPLSGDCEYTDVHCKYGCGENLERNELAEHSEMFCPKRPSICQYCDETGEHEAITGDHKKTCPEYPIQCPNGCEIEYVKQANLNQHLLECPDQITECDFNYAGCKVQILRKDLTSHLQEDMHMHFGLQTKFFIEKLEKKDEDLEKLAKEKDRQLEKLAKEKDTQLEKLAKEKDTQLEELAKQKDEQLNALDESWRCKYKQLADNLRQLVNQLWEIDRKELQLNTILVSGSFTEIWRGHYNKDKEVVIKKCTSTSDITIDNFTREAHVLINLQHKNIIQLYGICTKREPWYIVLEFMSQGNLLEYCHRNSTSIELQQKISILEQIASGLDYLEQNNYIHRSVKARNMLVGFGLACKVSGFHSAILLNKYGDEYEIPRGEKVPVKWSAPEVLKNRKYSVKSDVWSFGILLYEVITCGHVPYPGSIYYAQVVESILSGKTMAKPQGCTENLYKLMQDCWKMDCWARPTFEALVYQLADLEMEDASGYTVIF